MPVELVPIGDVTTPAEPAAADACPSMAIVRVEDATQDGCPILGKTRSVQIEKGRQATLEWSLRGRDGRGVDLTGCVICPETPPTVSSSSSSLSSSSSSSSSSSYSSSYSAVQEAAAETCTEGQVIFRFRDALGVNKTIHQIIGSVVSLQQGVVRSDLTEKLVERAGIYDMEIAVVDTTGKLVFTDRGYLSVDRGLFGDVTAGSAGGYPTVGDIRIQLRDTMVENRLLDEVEFDDVEIVHSILRPVREWNEKPPPVGVFNAATFPWYDHWMDAIIANLLLIAAHWYERNNMPATHGGVSVDDMKKANPYLQVATLLRGKWEQFILAKKVEINASLAMGVVGSPYSHW